MATVDDLPWPELGNVSRGATRGNQGQKGVLGPPDREGRCNLQLRVQPGVLAVRLNRQASDWYRILDCEVNRALKLTKTYWRKARRRQDYNARADQDHMELHEWLQQLKDKTMSHLELLMQKGDIQGPPYVMADDIELTFLRKFIERHAAGIPHNPRLRNSMGENGYTIRDDHSVDSGSPASDHSYGDHKMRTAGIDVSDVSSSFMVSSRNSQSPSLRNPETLAQEASTSKQALLLSRAALSRTQKETQDAFLRYTACLDAERQARQSVAAAEKRRDDIMGALLSMNQGAVDQQSRHSSLSLDESQRYHAEAVSRASAKLDWTETDAQAVYGTEPMTQLEDPSNRMVRKHSRTWDNTPLQPDGQYNCEVLARDFVWFGRCSDPRCEQDISAMPPRKRMNVSTGMMTGFDMLNSAAMQVQPQNMTLP
ncbi:hypothetical protein DFS33DRAFT_774281 [Desarmillaria ectypa]|nr:hypothetical protein DFS33DRAFT_774281 [Desarmillaria ectypa]